ncbi:hypothetical protein CONPUDRAFT_76751 [Coniophora puteana RWD-64-598 SS2]|uniref:Uncharacterized protein n=1 Tax=Coniophora puteana (strain RWD-64-598) TaxID=741705 RepID=A0A5M3MBY4_CONPW|nr:uncharacterized protein CONPUDRAFT_76751 [Coniophora puteana RWD-64-598 SS2]EIW76404.1 hypothetical protein CONPUDRAFT_76751 [Coniophora puteana RWD-64-598 SS2]
MCINTVSGLTIVVFDQVISFGLEIRRTSTRKYFVGTAAYVMLRYAGLLWAMLVDDDQTFVSDAISTSCRMLTLVQKASIWVFQQQDTAGDTDMRVLARCYQVYNVQQVTKYILTCLLQGMMAMRVWVLLGTPRKVYVILLTAFIISQGLSLVDDMLSILAYAGGSDHLNEHVVEGCSLRNTTPSWNRWLAPWSKGSLVAFELLLCLFAIIHIIKRARTHGASSYIFGNVVSTLIRGNLLYFFLAFFVLLVTALEEIQWVDSSKGLYWITFSALKYIFYGVIGPWMMLDIRKEAYGEHAVSNTANLKLSLLPRWTIISDSSYGELPSPLNSFLCGYPTCYFSKSPIYISPSSLLL